MARSTVNLTVHKNRVEKQKRRERVKDMVSGAKKMAQDNDLTAYAIVGITKTGDAMAYWDTGGSIPMWALPGAVYRVLDHDIAASEAAEDFKAPIREN